MRKILAVIPGTGDSNTFVFAKRQVEQMISLGLDVDVCYFEDRSRLKGILNFICQYRKRLKEFKPDVVHVHYGTITSLISTFFSCSPVVVTFRGSDVNPNSEGNHILVFVAHLMSQISAFSAFRVICVSEEMKRRLWCSKDKVSIIPSGVNIDEFIPFAKLEARKLLNMDLYKPLVLFNLGRSGLINKRLDLAEKAIKILNEKFEIELVILSGDIEPAKVYLYLNAVDVLLLNSNYEGSPTIIQEALACNTPICSTNVGDVEYMLDRVSNCVIVSRDPYRIAEGLEILVNNAGRSNGRDFSHRFSSQSNLDRVIQTLCF